MAKGRFTREEVSLMIEGLSAIEHRCDPSHAIPRIIDKAVTAKGEAELGEALRVEFQKHLDQHIVHREKVVMLQAKLLHLRDEMDVEDATTPR